MFEPADRGHSVTLRARGETDAGTPRYCGIVNFARAGYPKGVPATDTFPVLAVLPRTLPPALRHDRHA
ncbi:MAG: hypothetical protein CK429_22125 [Mycobacterium sp.]|nr:MAG: hypothetical protein CK429_22125 [Mycobacterium sp.]